MNAKISTLPQAIIETILCLLPIDDAARTSILSREWRYKWTTIPKLVFCNMIYKITEKKKARNCELLSVIHQVLLMRQAPIHEFTLSTRLRAGCSEANQIIFYLSRNHPVKKLTIESCDPSSYKLPACVFSLHRLTDLHLNSVNLDHQPIFNGFGSLRSLCLDNVLISTNSLLHLLSNCPSLTSLHLYTFGPVGDKGCTTVELFKYLPMIEHLTISGCTVELWLVLDSVPEELPTSLIYLKYFCFQDMCLSVVDVEYGFTLLAVLIKCSPNLEKIELEIDTDYSCCEARISSAIVKKYSHVWLEHLNELVIENFNNFESEMVILKFILARSPKLKKVRILSVVETEQEELAMLKALQQAPRLSPVGIVVRCCSKIKEIVVM